MEGDGETDDATGAVPPTAPPTVALEPIGEALRATYDADNHDSLGRDLTGLMLALARVEDVAPAASLPVAASAPVAPRSWRQRLFGR